MRKRILSTLLSLCMVLTMLPISALADEAAETESIEVKSAKDDLVETSEGESGEELADALVTSIENYELTNDEPVTFAASSGTCGDNLTWELNDEGTLVISGSGNMKDYTTSGPWSSNIKNVVIEEGVTSIGFYAFANCSELTNVSIPTSLTYIGYRAFYNCTSLTSITIPDSVTLIGSQAFYGCTSLATIIMPATIDGGVFSDCTAVAYVKLTGTGPMFDYSSSKDSTPWYIGSTSGTSVTVVIEEGITSIGRYAFNGCTGLSSASIPDSVTSIGERAFGDCSNLSSLTIPIKVTNIGKSAFYGCSGLTHISIPNSVTDIGDLAFAECSGLTNIVVSNNVTSIGEWTFRNCSNLTSVTLPANLDSIGERAFEGCSSLSDITIPDSVTSIELGAFCNCTSLTSVTIPDSVTSIGNSVFSGCSSLKNISISSRLTNISSSAFLGCSSLTSVMIPNNVTSIDSGAFSGCSSLTSVTISNSVTSIGRYAFSGCGSLTNVTMPATVSTLYSDSFAGCTAVTNVKLTGTGPMTDYTLQNGDGTCRYTPWYVSSKPVVVEIENGVTSIGDYAFKDCVGLVSITIPNSVTKIGYSAFDGCNKLTSISIPNSVTDISGNAFKNCTGLTDVTMPATASITTNTGGLSYGFGSFYGCTNVTNLHLTGVGAMVDYGEAKYGMYGPCEPSSASGKVIAVDIESGITRVGAYAFAECTGIFCITIPASVTSIGNSAFSGCSGLTDVYFGGSKEQWEAISVGSGNDRLSASDVTIHYTDTSITGPVRLLTEWDAENQRVRFNTDIIYYSITNETELPTENLETLVGRYVLVDSDDDTCSVRSIQAVDSSLGTVSAITTSTITIDGKAYPLVANVPFPDATVGSLVVYHLFDGRVVSLSYPTEKTGTLEEWKGTPGLEIKGEVTIDGDVYSTNYLTDTSFVANIEQVIGQVVSYWVLDGYVLRVSANIIKYEDILRTTGSFGFRTAVNEGKDWFYKYSYDESWFFKKSSDYQHDLVKMSMCVALAAYGANAGYEGSTHDGDERTIKELMLDLQFDADTLRCEYPSPSCIIAQPEKDTIGYAIGNKAIRSDSGEECSLILVAVRGGGYGGEWGANFRIGMNETHEGFQLAADQVLKGIQDYFSKNAKSLSPNYKIWITGYSRAAATANLVAAALTDGIPGVNVNPDNIFAFCFECPQNTRSSQASDEKYKNIVNIINPIDFVPKVAMTDWGYRRYGTDYYLPYAEATANYNYSSLKQRMIKEYQNILDYEYEDGENKLSNPLPDNSLSAQSLSQEANGQSSILNTLMGHMCKALANRETYNEKYQDEMVSIFKKALGGDSFEGVSYDNLLLALKNYLFPLNAPHPTRIPSVINGIRLFAVDVSVDNPESLFNGQIKIESINGYGPAARAHYPELCLAWLNALEGRDEYADVRYRKLLINCPVNISVYDSNNRLVAQVIDDTVQEIDGGLVAYLDEYGQKVIALPNVEEYTVKLVATDDGTVTYTATEYNIASSSTEKVVSYYEIDVANGDKLTGLVENLAEVDSADYPLYLNDEEESLIPFVIQEKGEVQEYTVEVAVSGNGSAVGDGKYVNGTFAEIFAVADSGWEFQGWHVGDTLISTDTDYRFLVSKDISITAVFTKQEINPDVFTVTFNANNGTVSPATITTGEDGTLAELPTPVREGYTFDGWFTMLDGGEKITTNTVFTEDTTVYAHWTQTITPPEPTVFTITFNANNGTVTPSTMTTDGEGKLAELPTPTRDGYTFDGWFTTLNGGKKITTDTVFTEDTTVYAHWTQIITPPEPTVFTITFNANNGTVTPSTMTTNEEGKLAELPTPVRNGYSFNGWFTALTGGTQVTVNTVFTSDATVYARWTYNSGIHDGNNWYPPADSTTPTTYRIAVPAVSGGTVNVSPTSAKKGDTVTIIVTPDSGYELDYITVTDRNGNDVPLTARGNGKYVFTMPDGNVTLDCAFKFIKADSTDQPTISFIDVVPNTYYYNAVTWAVVQRITNGTTATTFSPNAPCTRGQIVTFLWRAAGSPSVSGSSPFTDVQPGDYWYDAVLWAVSKGITSGTSATTFSPNDTCTRGQAVTFLYRNAGSPTVTTSATFTDVALNAYYSDAVAWALAKSITNGTTATTFSPNDKCTRGQIVTFLYRNLGK